MLEQLRIERPIVIGNSIGGAAALLHARTHPVRALVLCDPSGLVAVTALVSVVCALFAAGERGARWYQPVFRFY